MPREAELRIAELERMLAARDRTIAVLMDRVEERIADGSSSFAVLQQSIALEHVVTRKTRELDEQRRQLADALHELQTTQAELTQAHKLSAIGQLAAGVAHEINTPIQYLGDNLAFLELVLAQLLPVAQAAVALVGDAGNDLTTLRAAVEKLRMGRIAAQVPRALEHARDGIARVTTIVAAMKAFAHPSGGEKVETDLREAIDSTVTIARNEWKYVAELELQIASDLPRIYCVRDELNQVVLNLVINAAHAIADVVGDTGVLGRIVVSARLDGPWCEIRVADTGAGIPEAMRERIFEPFFTTKPVGKGTGQGLAIARSVVVDKHGGTITFESEPGRGTVFVIRIPAHAQHDAAA